MPFTPTTGPRNATLHQPPATPAREAATVSEAPAPHPPPKPNAGILSGLQAHGPAAARKIAHTATARSPHDFNRTPFVSVGGSGKTLSAAYTRTAKPVPAAGLEPIPEHASLAKTFDHLAYSHEAESKTAPVDSMKTALSQFDPTRNAARSQSRPRTKGENSRTGFTVMAKRRFPTTGTAATRNTQVEYDRLIEDIEGACAPLGTTRGARLEHAALLVEALSAATRQDAALATKVLDRLKQGLTLGPSPARTIDAAPGDAGHTGAASHQDTAGSGAATPSAPPGQPGSEDAKVEELAWRTAQHLAATAGGYETLHEIAGKDWPATGPAQDAPRQWLRATDALVAADDGRCSAVPDSIGRRIAELLGGDDANRSQNATATQTHAASIASAAAKVWRTGATDSLSAADKGALLAARQDFYADGPGTPFAASRTRMARFVNHAIPRAATDNVEGTRTAEVSEKRTLLQSAARPIGINKSAVAAMHRGVHGVDLGTFDKDRKVIANATRGALTALDDARPAAPPNPYGKTPRPLDSVFETRHARRIIGDIVSHAELKTLGSEAAGDPAQGVPGNTPPYGKKIDDDMLSKIAENTAKAIDQVAGDLPDPASARDRRLSNTLNAFNSRLKSAIAQPDAPASRKTFAGLRRRLTNGSDVLDHAKLAVWNTQQGNTSAGARTALKTLDRTANAAGVKPAGKASSELRAAGDEIIDNLESSGKAVFTDGGTLGLSTRGFTTTVATAVVVAPIVTVQGSKGRQATLEYSRSTPSYMISFGTRDRWRAVVGAGVQVGQDFGAGRIVGRGEIDTQWDNTGQCTVDLRIARRLKPEGTGFDDVKAKRQMKEVNEFLFDPANRGKNDKELWNELGGRFFEHEDFTVAWNNQTTKIRRWDGAVGVQGGGKVGAGAVSGRFSARAGVAYEYVASSEFDSSDASGQLRTESHRFGRGHRTALQASITANAGDNVHAPTHEAASGARGTSVSQTVLPGNLLTAEVLFNDGFHLAKVSLVRENGRISHRTSTADTEFADLDHYEKALRDDPAWSLAIGTKAASESALPQSHEELERSIQKGRQKIDEHIAELRANRQLNQRFVHRRRLREHAAQGLDHLDDRIAMLTAHSKNDDAAAQDELQALRDDRHALMSDPRSWVPTELMTLSTDDQHSSAGLRIGLQATAQSGARGEHEMLALKLGPHEADALDAALRRVDNAGSEVLPDTAPGMPAQRTRTLGPAAPGRRTGEAGTPGMSKASAAPQRTTTTSAPPPVPARSLLRAPPAARPGVEPPPRPPRSPLRPPPTPLRQAGAPVQPPPVQRAVTSATTMPPATQMIIEPPTT